MSARTIKKRLGQRIGGWALVTFAGLWMYMLGLDHINTFTHPLMFLPAFLAAVIGAPMSQARIRFSRTARFGRGHIYKV